MKRIFQFVIIAVTALLYVSCEYDKVYVNGDLDGMWRLIRVETNDDDITPESVYYSFQRHLVQISKHHEIDIPTRFLGNLHYRGDTISMSGFINFPYETQAATLDDLKEFYLYSDSTMFIINRLDDEMLIMRNCERTYTLRRW